VSRKHSLVKPGDGQSEARHEAILSALHAAAHWLPVQGPIGVFIHHNTLHTLQHLTFEEAVVEAAKRLGTEPFLTEERFQEERDRGRIQDQDIDAVLSEEPDVEILPNRLSRRALRRSMLIPGVRRFSPPTLGWLVDECGLLERLRTDLASSVRARILGGGPDVSEARATSELYLACRARQVPGAEPQLAPIQRPRDGILRQTGIDADEAVHPWLIRLCAVFVDQGISYWPMPHREAGLYAAVRGVMCASGMLEPQLLSGTVREFAAQAAAGKTPVQVVADYLDFFGASPDEYEALLTAELLALPGWAGLVYRLEEAPELAPYEEIKCALIDFLAVRLTLAKVAAANVWRAGEATGDVRSGWRTASAPSPDPEAEYPLAAIHLFDVAQLLGLSAADVRSLDDTEFARWAEEVRLFDDSERRRVLHLAYECRHERLILDPLRLHRRELDPTKKGPRPAAQVMFCIDEREESMRRALEETDPEVETFAAAGFFGAAVNYRGLDDPHGVALCPVVVTPQHAVLEKPKADADALMDIRRQARRKVWSDLARGTSIGSRTLVRGWVGTIGLGVASLVPLLARVLAPHHTGRFNAWLHERLLPQPRTELAYVRQEAAGHQIPEGLHLGFSLTEKTDRVAGVLRPAGLVSGFARIVVILGHGSTSLNNPHESAHDCGACGGRRGGPNARLFAAMANHPEVREQLRGRGVSIPEDTWFVGGYHDTCNDDVLLSDVELVPESHREDFARIRQSLDRARAGNALERARRFEAAWKDETPEQALRHVQERAGHLAEPRPEYGHATNAVCVVGRRCITRGLFMDRRAFLVSYDASIDPDDQLLSALLGAGGPVCAGINLEYYFSYVDNERYGCGTKLPHNVTGLVGIMNGHASDLRTGLPWQMVEVHEPVRLLLIVETTPERLGNAVGRSALVTELVQKRWLRVAAIDPDDGTIQVYRDGTFEPMDEPDGELPEAPTSADWYRGKLEHLPLARIRPTAPC